LATSDLPELRE
jgi:hypothetical protein